MTLYRSYAGKLAPLQPAGRPEEEKPLLSPEESAEASETIKELSAAFDFDNIMFVLKSLEDYRLSEEDRKRWLQIRAAAEKPDWDKLNDLLK